MRTLALLALLSLAGLSARAAVERS